ncbi:MAG: hypothetical protein IVW55_13260 [Chloroflexi bacterium]|nr:hypothetical protein [Chloroflexota bacterium]
MSVGEGHLSTQRITTFQTSDNPADIFAFYKDALLKYGWQLINEQPNFLTLGYDTPDSNAQGPKDPTLPPSGGYTLYIETTALSGRGTNVKVYYIVENRR